MTATPPASSDAVRLRMQKQRRRDTAAELALRRAAHRLGLRYRVDAPLPIEGLRRRRADLLFSGAQIACYVDSCYYHRCPTHGTTPKSNSEWWIAKLDANVARDRDTDARLRAAGWEVIRFWEHADPSLAAMQLATLVATRRTSPHRSDRCG